MCQITHIKYRCGCHFFPEFHITVPCARNCGQPVGDIDTRLGPEPCGIHATPPFDPRSLEAFNRAEHKVPRFLFRGFHGANMATIRGLNTRTGVYPFGYPPDQVDLPRRPQVDAAEGIPNAGLPEETPLIDYTYDHHITLAEYHVEFNTQAPVETPFTSWSADFTTALWFGCGSYAQRKQHINVLEHGAQGYVCVLDTVAFLPPGHRGHRIIHAPDLGWSALPFEYFIHGPVFGDGFRCISLADIQRVLNCTRFPFCPTPYGAPPPPPPPPSQSAIARAHAAGFPALFAHLLSAPAAAQPAPQAASTSASHHIPVRDEIAYAVRVGSLFQRPGDRDIDITLTVAAFMLARTQFNITPGSATPVEERWFQQNLFITGPGMPINLTVDRDVAQAIGTRLFPVALDLPPISRLALANTHMDTLAQPQLQWAKNLLLRLDAFWRSLGMARVGTTVPWRNALTVVEGPEHVCPVRTYTGTQRRGTTFFTTPPRSELPRPYSRSPSTPG